MEVRKRKNETVENLIKRFIRKSKKQILLKNIKSANIIKTISS